MKKYIFFLLSFLAVSCAKSRMTPEQQPVFYEMGLAASGELAQVKAKAPVDALYVVAVYEADASQPAVAANDANRYAIGVFSDPAYVALRMASGKRYLVRVKAILGGEEGLYHIMEGGYKSYQNIGHLTNRMQYHASSTLDANLYGKVNQGSARTEGSAAAVEYPLLDTYYGETSVVPGPGMSRLTVDMYRMATGVKVLVNGLQEGDGTVNVVYYIGGNTRDEFGGSLAYRPGEETVFSAVHTYAVLATPYAAAAAGEDYSGVTMSMQVTYTSPSGETRDIGSAANMHLHRNKYHVVTVNLSH